MSQRLWQPVATIATLYDLESHSSVPHFTQRRPAAVQILRGTHGYYSDLELC